MSFDIEEKSYDRLHPVPREAGRGHTRTINIGNRLRLINRHIVAEEALEVPYRHGLPESTTVGALTLGGNSHSDLNGLKKRIHHHKGNYHWGYIPDEPTASLFPRGKEINMLWISVHQDLLSRFPESIEPQFESPLWRIMAGQEHGVCAPRVLPAPMVAALHEVVSSPIGNPWDWLRVEARALEAIGQCLFEPTQEKGPPPITLSAQDRERLFLAKDLLESSLCDPPGISDLARACGVNEFKLKKGFKQLFGTTPFAYLRTYRMTRAFQLLSSGKMNITETAVAVGYANPCAFSSAFRKAYGMNPADCKKKSFQVPDKIQAP